MTNEFNALISNSTWTLVPASQATNIVSCKWVFRTKCLADDTLERRKARLIAKGFLQQSGVDYEETFSPVVKTTTIRFVLAFAITKGWPINQYDMQNAFLHGPLSEIVLIAQPQASHICNF